MEEAEVAVEAADPARPHHHHRVARAVAALVAHRAAAVAQPTLAAQAHRVDMAVDDTTEAALQHLTDLEALVQASAPLSSSVLAL